MFVNWMCSLQSQTHNRHVRCLGKSKINRKIHSGAPALGTCWKHLPEICHFYDVLRPSLWLQFPNICASAAGRMFSAVVRPDLRSWDLFFGTRCKKKCAYRIWCYSVWTQYNETYSCFTRATLLCGEYLMCLYNFRSQFFKKKNYINRFPEIGGFLI